MCVALTIPERLRDLRAKRQVDQAAVEKETEISSSALSTYKNDEQKDISHRAIIKLAKYYGVTADYLLGLTEIKNHLNAELHELHLSDDMIELLKSGKINNRFLCEMVAHESFWKLIADIEIYVGRIASMQFANIALTKHGNAKQRPGRFFAICWRFHLKR